MPKPSPFSDALDTWGLMDEAPLFSMESALLLGFSALALLFSLTI